MNISIFRIKVLVISSLLAIPAFAQTPYEEGQKALREAQWMAAVKHFEDAMGGDQTDAAMYWRAYALYKADHRGEAARQISDLEEQFPASRWVKEAKALQIEYQGSIEDANQEDELRLFALSHLMDRDAKRALPLVLEILHNTKSDRTRRDALFILGISDQPEARQAIADLARHGEDPDLRAEAVQILGNAATPSSMALLKEIYGESDSEQIREAVINACVAAGQPEPLLDFLQREQKPELQRHIIHALGAMGATGSLEKIYPTLSGHELRVAALEAFSMTGDPAMLHEVLKTETDPGLRRSAIQGIAMIGGAGAVEYLEGLYDTAASREEKVALLDSLAMLKGGESLAVKIVRNETDPGLQRRAIEMLGVLGATDDLAKLYGSLQDSRVRQTVLEAMGMAGNTAGLLEVLKTETDPDLRIAAIHGLAMAHQPGVGQHLAELYPKGSHREKQAVIESLLMAGDAKGLIGLLEQETEPELRREMMQGLSAMDSEEATEYMFKMLEHKPTS